MGEVQYIVTLPQTTQPSTIQLPSNKSKEFVLIYLLIIRRTNYSIISSNTIATRYHWCECIRISDEY